MGRKYAKHICFRKKMLCGYGHLCSAGDNHTFERCFSRTSLPNFRFMRPPKLPRGVSCSIHSRPHPASASSLLPAVPKTCQGQLSVTQLVTNDRPAALPRVSAPRGPSTSSVYPAPRAPPGKNRPSGSGSTLQGRPASTCHHRPQRLSTALCDLGCLSDETSIPSPSDGVDQTPTNRRGQPFSSRR